MKTNTENDQKGFFIPQLKYLSNNFKSTLRYRANRQSLKNAIKRYKKTGIPSIDNLQRIGLKLTNACNLRCTMCFQWREGGIHNIFPSDELRIDKCHNILSFLDKYHASYYLWGGEPLLASDFDSFVEEICKRGNTCNICTNGILIDRHMKIFEKYNENIIFIISLDGPQEINDKIRGKGSFQKTVKNIQELVNKKRKYKMKWLIGIEITIMPENIAVLRDTVRLCQALGADILILNHLWIISKNAREEYKQFCKEMGYNQPLSIEGFGYPSFEPSYVDNLLNQINLIRQDKRKIPIRFMPPLSSDDLRKYYTGEKIGIPMPCYKHGLKIDIKADGDVVACKQFPDIVLGNIYQNKIEDILSSEKYQKISRYFHKKGLDLCYSCPETYNLRI